MSFFGCHILAQHSSNTNKCFIVFVFYDNPSASCLGTSLYTREALFFAYTYYTIFKSSMSIIFNLTLRSVMFNFVIFLINQILYKHKLIPLVF